MIWMSLLIYYCIGLYWSSSCFSIPCPLGHIWLHILLYVFDECIIF